MENLDLNLKAIDLDKAASGVWIEYDDGISFLIARSNSQDYKTAVRRMHKQYKYQIDNETLSDAKSDALMAGLIASHILIGWKGLESSGEEFKYTRDNAIALLSDERYGEIRAWIMVQADDLENFRSAEAKKQKTRS